MDMDWLKLAFSPAAAWTAGPLKVGLKLVWLVVTVSPPRNSLTRVVFTDTDPLVIVTVPVLVAGGVRDGTIPAAILTSLLWPVTETAVLFTITSASLLAVTPTSPSLPVRETAVPFILTSALLVALTPESLLPPVRLSAIVIVVSPTRSVALLASSPVLVPPLTFNVIAERSLIVTVAPLVAPTATSWLISVVEKTVVFVSESVE
jgi:hypothetical protein